MVDQFSPGVAQRSDLWEVVAAELRQAIVTGTIAPEVHLQESVLAQKFGVSKASIHEALFQLEHEGLVRSEPRRGAFAVGLGGGAVQEIYDLRRLLEVEAGRLATPRASAPDLARLQSLVHQMAEAIGREDARQLAELDITFHREIFTIAGHRRIQSAWEPIAGIIATLLRLTDAFARNKQVIIHTHQIVVDALAAGNPDAVERAIRQHLDAGVQTITEVLRDQLPRRGK